MPLRAGSSQPRAGTVPAAAARRFWVSGGWLAGRCCRDCRLGPAGFAVCSVLRAVPCRICRGFAAGPALAEGCGMSSPSAIAATMSSNAPAGRPAAAGPAGFGDLLGLALQGVAGPAVASEAGLAIPHVALAQPLPAPGTAAPTFTGPGGRATGSGPGIPQTAVPTAGQPVATPAPAAMPGPAAMPAPVPASGPVATGVPVAGPVVTSTPATPAPAMPVGAPGQAAIPAGSGEKRGLDRKSVV